MLIFRCDLCDYKGLATNANVVSALLANHKKKCHKEEYEFGQRVFVQGKMRIPTPLNILSPWPIMHRGLQTDTSFNLSTVKNVCLGLWQNYMSQVNEPIESGLNVLWFMYFRKHITHIVRNMLKSSNCQDSFLFLRWRRRISNVYIFLEVSHSSKSYVHGHFWARSGSIILMVKYIWCLHGGVSQNNMHQVW